MKQLYVNKEQRKSHYLKSDDSTEKKTIHLKNNNNNIYIYIYIYIYYLYSKLIFAES